MKKKSKTKDRRINYVARKLDTWKKGHDCSCGLAKEIDDFYERVGLK